MIRLNLLAKIMQHLFVKKNQLITIFFNFISRYNEDNFLKKIRKKQRFILTKQKVGKEELDNEYHISFLQKLGGFNVIRKSKTIPLSAFLLEPETITHLLNDCNVELHLA